MLLPLRIGHARAFAMFAMGEALDGREAAALGLANGRLTSTVATAVVFGGLLTLIPASVGAVMMPSSAVESSNAAENPLEGAAGRP